MNDSNQKGFGLIEMIVAIAVGMIIFVPVVLYLNFSLKIAAEDVSRVEALYLAKSSLEQARSIRDEDWANLNVLTKNSAYHFDPNPLIPIPNPSTPRKWVSDTGSNTVGRYTVWVILSSVHRDNTTHNVVTPFVGSYEDNKTLKITANVSYMTRNGERQINLHEYLTNF